MKRKHFLLKKSFDAKQFFILDNISVSICYINAATLRYKFVNNAFSNAYNIPREKIIGKHLSKILPAKNYQNAIKYISEVKKGRNVTF